MSRGGQSSFGFGSGREPARGGTSGRSGADDKGPVVKNADMDDDMKDDVMRIAEEAMEKFKVEKDRASFIKREFDKEYQPTWHCVVGKHFGSYVTHESKNFIYFYIGPMAFLLWKSG